MKKIYYTKTKQEKDDLVEILNKEYPFEPYMTEIYIEEIKDEKGNFVEYMITLSVCSLD